MLASLLLGLMAISTGYSRSPTAASFVRPLRPGDNRLKFLAALSKRYGSNENHTATSPSKEQIHISGKAVEKVGFEKIQQKQANLQDLSIVSLDGLCVGDSEKDDESSLVIEWRQIKAQGLKIVELDLSDNLLERWTYVVCICSALRQTLRSLSLK